MSKKPLMSEAVQMQLIGETGQTAREFLKVTGKVADRVVQASLSSPYYTVSAIAILSAMMVRANLIPAFTSQLVTGTGLALLGSSAVFDSFPIISGITDDAYIDNEYDQNAISPWATPENTIYLDERLEKYLSQVEA